MFCFGLPDQFATWLGVDIFKYCRVLNFFLEKYNFREVCSLGDFGIGLVVYVSRLVARTNLGTAPAEG